MTDLDAAVAIQKNWVDAHIGLVASAATGSSLYRRTGLVGAVVPSAPTARLLNWLVSWSPETLGAALDDIDAAYMGAGVATRWLWVHPAPATDVVLRDAGYTRTEDVPALILDLRSFVPADLADLDYDADGDIGTLGRVNAVAYGLGGEIASGLAHDPPGLALRVYQARWNGRAASVLCAVDCQHLGQTDCALAFAATIPEARGRGLAPRLAAAALRDAQMRGCTTSSGSASVMGAPVWARLGYETAFRFATYALTHTRAR